MYWIFGGTSIRFHRGAGCNLFVFFEVVVFIAMFTIYHKWHVHLNT